jgi:anti-sigma factor RsiW
MNSGHINDRLDDYMDGHLAEAEVAAFTRHVESCASCRETLDRERRLRGLLQRYPAATPDVAYFDQALIRAAHVGTGRQRNRWIMTGFGAAVAAGLVAWIIGGTLLKAPDLPEPAAAIPGVTMALEQPHTVNLVFSSATALDDAVLTVSLPAGLELVGFAGRQEITWMTSLKPGKNILPLQLIALTPQGGELLARLQHDNRDRTFRIRVTVS